MGFKTFISNFFTNKKHGYSNSFYDNFGGDSGDGICSFTIEDAIKNNYFFTASKVLSETISSIPLNGFSRDKNGKKNRLNSGSIYRLLKRKPNSYQTPAVFKSQIAMHLIFKGNCFLWKNKDIKTGEIIGLTPLNPDNVEVKLVNFQKTFLLKTSQIIYSENEILHIPGFSLDGISGISLIEYAGSTLTDSNTLRKFTRKYFRNGSFVSGILQQTKDTISESSQKVFKSKWENRNTSFENAGKVDVVPDGFEYKQLTVNAKDLVLIEALGQSLLDVARLFRLSPHLLGDLSNSGSYNSLEMLNQEFLEFTILPLCTFIQDALNTGLFKDESQFVEFDFANFLKTDLVSTANALSQFVQNSMMTPNEARAKLNLEPVDSPEANSLIFNLNQTSNTPPKQTNTIKKEVKK